MALKIEELVVTLSAEIDEYKKRLSEAENKANTSGNKITGAFKKIGSGVDGVISGLFNLRNLIAGGAVAILVKHSLDAADSISKLSARIGINTSFLQEMQFAASQSGISQDQLTTSLQMFTRTVGEAANGNETYLKTFRELGVEIKNSDGSMKSSEAAFIDVAAAISEIPNQSQKAAYAMELFGRSGALMLNLFDGGPEKIRAFQDEANRLGLVLDGNLLKGAEAANDEMDKLQRVISAQLTNAVLQIAPSLKEMGGVLVQLAVASKPIVDGFARMAVKTAEFFGATESGQTKIELIKNKIADLTKELIHTEKGTSFFLRSIYGLSAAARPVSEITAELNKYNQKLAEQEQANISASEAQNLFTESVKTGADAKAEADAREEEIVQTAMERNTLMQGLKDEAFIKEMQQNQALIDDYTKKQQDKLATGEKASITYLKMVKDRSDKERKDEENKELEIKNQKEKFNNNMQALMSSSSKELFEIGKAYSIAKATIDTWEGAQAAYKAFSYFPPLAIAAAAAATAAGLSRVASISSTTFKAQEGGVVPGIGRGDKVNSLLEPGEGILRRDTMKRIEENLNSGSGIGSSGEISLKIGFADQAFEIIEAKLLERKRIGISLEAN